LSHQRGVGVLPLLCSLVNHLSRFANIVSRIVLCLLPNLHPVAPRARVDPLQVGVPEALEAGDRVDRRDDHRAPVAHHAVTSRDGRHAMALSAASTAVTASRRVTAHHADHVVTAMIRPQTVALLIPVVPVAASRRVTAHHADHVVTAMIRPQTVALLIPVVPVARPVMIDRIGDLAQRVPGAMDVRQRVPVRATRDRIPHAETPAMRDRIPHAIHVPVRATRDRIPHAETPAMRDRIPHAIHVPVRAMRDRIPHAIHERAVRHATGTEWKVSTPIVALVCLRAIDMSRSVMPLHLVDHRDLVRSSVNGN